MNNPLHEQQGQSTIPEADVWESAESGFAVLCQLHAVLLMMLKDFAQICEAEGFRWIVHYGTALGAMRHGGFIPWDDDVDICMPREDLEELVRVVGLSANDKYMVVNSTSYPGYPMATTRFVLRGTEFHDQATESLDFPSGIFLDLFPLDNLPDDDAALKRQVWRSWLYNHFAMVKEVSHPYVEKSVKGAFLKTGASAAHLLLNAPGLRRIDFNELTLKWLLMYANEDTERLGFPCNRDRFWTLHRKDELFPVRYVAFEDMEVPVANQIERLLDIRYGDWRVPPPPEQRFFKHPSILDFGPYQEIASKAEHAG